MRLILEHYLPLRTIVHVSIYELPTWVRTYSYEGPSTEIEAYTDSQRFDTIEYLRKASDLSREDLATMLMATTSIRNGTMFLIDNANFFICQSRDRLKDAPPENFEKCILAPEIITSIARPVQALVCACNSRLYSLHWNSFVAFCRKFKNLQKIVLLHDNNDGAVAGESSLPVDSTDFLVEGTSIRFEEQEKKELCATGKYGEHWIKLYDELEAARSMQRHLIKEYGGPLEALQFVKIVIGRWKGSRWT